MKIITTKIDTSKPYKNNAKLHPPEQVKLIAKSLERFGFNQAIVVDKHNEIVAGHGRYLAALLLEMKDVPVVKLEGLTPKEINAYRMIDNQLNQISGQDMNLVKEEWLEIDDMGLFEISGYDADMLVSRDDKEDEVPELPKKPQSKVGDIYILGKHTLLCGDATAGLHMDKLMDKTKADLVFTDPPYNVNIEGKGKKTSNKILNDNMSDDAFDLFLTEVFKRYSEHSKDGTPWYVFHSPTTQHQFSKAIENAGWRVKSQLIWNKPSAGLGMNEFRAKHEPFFYCVNGKAPFYGDRTNTTIWDFHKSVDKLVAWANNQLRAEKEGITTIWSMKRENVGEYLHPTQKPIELIANALHNSSKAGDVVLDLFGGSGATLIACEKYNRERRMMELDPRYVDLIVQRYVDYAGDKNITKNGKEVTWN